MVARKRQAYNTCRALRSLDLEAEDIPPCGPLGREPAQRGREADIDIRQIADLGHDCPSRTSFAKKLDAANIGLHDPSAREPTTHSYDKGALELTVKELVGPVAHPCACEIRGSLEYGA